MEHHCRFRNACYCYTRRKRSNNSITAAARKTASKGERNAFEKRRVFKFLYAVLKPHYNQFPGNKSVQMSSFDFHQPTQLTLGTAGKSWLREFSCCISWYFASMTIDSQWGVFQGNFLLQKKLK